MRAYWACRDIGNFGDLITPYILFKLGYSVSFCENTLKENHVFLSGSILQEATHRTTVIGSGFGARSQKTKHPDIKMVRGKVTDEMLVDQGYDGVGVYGDPGLALPNLYHPKIEKKHRLGVIPHYIDDPYVPDDCKKINVLDPVEKVVDDIISCEYLISSSLHGIIVAHAYKMPCLWVKFSDKIAGDGMKYEDYFTSVGIISYTATNLIEKKYSSNIIEDIPTNTGSIDSVYDNISRFLTDFYSTSKIYSVVL
jgi:pyruvyltransferase